MWEDYQKTLGTKYLKVIGFFVGFVALVVVTQILFSRYTTSSGEDMVDRTNLLIWWPFVYIAMTLYIMDIGQEDLVHLLRQGKIRAGSKILALFHLLPDYYQITTKYS